jgi:hypothetical protein
MIGNGGPEHARLSPAVVTRLDELGEEFFAGLARDERSANRFAKDKCRFVGIGDASPVCVDVIVRPG